MYFCIIVNYMGSLNPFSDYMGGRDISDMSFDEFFLGKKPPEAVEAVRSSDAKSAGADSEIDDSRFIGGRPKINLRPDSIVLFVPRYEGGRGARYEAAIHQDEKVLSMGRLKSSPLNSDTVSIPTTLDLLDAGIDPLKRFVLVIDGIKAYESFERVSMMFNIDGMPISRAEDTTQVLHRSSTSLWLSNAKISTTREIGDLVVDTVEVSKGGYVRIRNKPLQQEKAERGKEKEAPRESRQAESAVHVLSGSLHLPPSEPSADVLIDGAPVPLYSGAPDITLDIHGADEGDCLVRVQTSGRNDDVPSISFGKKALEGAVGDTRISLIHDGAELASCRLFIIPGFSCSYNGKGDLYSEEELTFDLGDGPIVRNVLSDDLAGPYDFQGGAVSLSWNLPVATVDVGSGLHLLKSEEVSTDDLPDSIVVSVRGASKKAVFMGSGGKKINLTPDWSDETIRIDSTVVENAVFASPMRETTLFITVNSFAVRPFLRVRNDPGMSASCSDGIVRVSITGMADYECRVFDVDRSTRTYPLQMGDNEIDVGAGAISADIIESRGGKVLATESIQIRELPFLMRDDMGDVWFYVSRERRIPLPDGLLEKRSDASEIRRWHAQIVRMNPELKSISPEKTVKAFKDFEKQ